MSRSGVSEIFGYIRNAHQELYHEPLIIHHEHISLFNATRNRVPLPIGWNDVIKGLPQDLLNKTDPDGKQYDKIIYISRGLLPLTEALAKYHRKAKSKLELINLMLEEPKFFSNIKKRWLRMEEPIEDPRFLKITLEDWNWYTLQTYDIMLDFLGFAKEGRPRLVPINLTHKRNFDGYSCSHLPKEYEMCENIKEIRIEDGN